MYFMAKQKVSAWADRRWKVFENEYTSNTKFRAEIDKLKGRHIFDTAPILINLTAQYGVSYSCIMAIIKFLENPNLKRNEYLSEISQPIKIWSAGAEFVEGNIRSTLKSHFKYLLRQYGLKVTKNGNEISEKHLAFALTQYDTVIQLSPYLKITEVHELIDEHWNEIQAQLNSQSSRTNELYSSKLLGNVQPPKPKTKTERDNLILKLAEDRVSVKDTIAQLVYQGYASEKSLTPSNVRRIRSIMKKRK